MSTSFSAGLSTAAKYALPAFTLLLCGGGTVGGLYAINYPDNGARLFGVPIDGSSSKNVPRVYVRTLGIRNLSNGLIMLSFMALHGIAHYQGLDVASTVVKRCLGVSMSIGTFVGLADSWAIGKYIEEAGGVGVDDDVREKASGHMWVAPVIGLIGIGWLTV